MKNLTRHESLAEMLEHWRGQRLGEDIRLLFSSGNPLKLHLA